MAESHPPRVHKTLKLFEDDELREKIVHGGIATGKKRTVQNSYKKFKHTLEDMLEE
jgi:hypothetical protein